MSTTFILTVEEALDDDQALRVCSDLEEVLGKHSLSLDISTIEFDDGSSTSASEV